MATLKHDGSQPFVFEPIELTEEDRRAQAWLHEQVDKICREAHIRLCQWFGIPSWLLGIDPVNTRDAFLKAICDAPDDDGPRLMYADWLMGQDRSAADGEPTEAELARAEFIQLDVRLASEPWAVELKFADYQFHGPGELVGWATLPSESEARRAVQGVAPGTLVRGSLHSVGGVVPLALVFREWVETAATGDRAFGPYAAKGRFEVGDCRLKAQIDRHFEDRAERGCLLRAWAGEWLAAPLACARELDERTDWFVWRRGFVEKVILPGVTWVHVGDRLRACLPTLREVELTSLPQFLRGTPGEWHTGGRLYHLVGRQCVHEVPSAIGFLVWQDMVLPLLEKEWPGLKFQFRGYGTITDPTLASFNRLATRLFDHSIVLPDSRNIITGTT